MIDQTPQVPPRPSFGLTVEEMGRLTEIVGRLSQAELPLPEVLLGMANDMPSKALANEAIVRVLTKYFFISFLNFGLFVVGEVEEIS